MPPPADLLREHIDPAPVEGEGILYARLALGPHRNFVYLLGDPTTGRAAVIDAAWDVPRILRILDAWDCRLDKALFTHHHPDHTQGARQIAETTDATLHIHRADAPELTRQGLEVRTHTGGERLAVGAATLRCHHTPGHTAGATTYAAGKRLFTGDFLFIGTCGRTDFPTGSTDAMWRSLQWLKRSFSDDHVVCPGHDYGDVPEASLGDQKRSNPALMHTDPERFGTEWFLKAY